MHYSRLHSSDTVQAASAVAATDVRLCLRAAVKVTEKSAAHTIVPASSYKMHYYLYDAQELLPTLKLTLCAGLHPHIHQHSAPTRTRT